MAPGRLLDLVCCLSTRRACVWSRPGGPRAGRRTWPAWTPSTPLPTSSSRFSLSANSLPACLSARRRWTTCAARAEARADSASAASSASASPRWTPGWAGSKQPTTPGTRPEPAGAPRAPGEVTTGRVEWFLKSEGAVSYSRAKRSRTVPNQIFTFALRNDAMHRNPVEGTSPLPRPKKPGQGGIRCVPPVAEAVRANRKKFFGVVISAVPFIFYSTPASRLPSSSTRPVPTMQPATRRDVCGREWTARAGDQPRFPSSHHIRPCCLTASADRRCRRCPCCRSSR